MFEFKGQDWTVEDIQAAADKTGSSYDDALAELKKVGMVEKQDQNTSWFEAAQEWLLPSMSELNEALSSGLSRADAYSPSQDIYSISSKSEAANMSDKELEAYIKAVNEAAKKGNLVELKKWSDSYQKNRDEGENMFMSTLVAIGEEGLDGFAQVMVQSMAGLANKEILAIGGGSAAVVGGGTGIATGGVGAIPAGAAAFFGAANTAAETMMTFNELLQEELKERNLKFTPDNIRAVMSDDDARGAIKRKATLRGVTIGAVEGVSSLVGIKGAGAVAKATSKAGNIVSKTAGATTAAVVEAVGGSAGEAAGMAAAGQEFNEQEIILEGIAGMGKAPLDLALGTVSTVKNSPKYYVDGVKVSKKSLDDYVNNATAEELAAVNIDVENDAVTKEKINDIRLDSAIDSQLDTRVTNVEDRAELLKLEKDLLKLGDKKTRSGQAEKKRIQSDIDSVLNKYEGVEADASLEQAKQNVGEARLEKSISFAEKQGARIGKQINVLDNDDTAQQTYDKLLSEGKVKKSMNVKGTDGFIVGDQIYINKETASKTGAISVGSHEILHGIIGNSFGKLDADARTKLGKSFMNTLTRQQRRAVEKRLKNSYKLEGEAALQSEEMFTAFSDAIEKNEITFNEGVFSKIGNAIEEVLRNLSEKGLISEDSFLFRKEFSNGRQAYNFLKDYNQSVKVGELSQRQMAFAEVDAEVTPEQVAKESRTYTKTDRDVRIDKLGEQYTKEEYGSAKNKKPGKGTDVYFEMYASGDLEAMVRSRITGELRRTPGFLEEDFVNEVLGELKNHVENFDITRKETNEGFGLAGWIRAQVGNKIGNVLKRGAVTEETFTKDIDESTEAQAVAAEQQDISNLEEQDLSARAQVQRQQVESKESEQKYSQFRQEIGFETGGKNYNKVLDATRKSLLLAYKKTESIKDPKQRVDAIIKMLREEYVTKGITSDLFKPLRETFGKKDYLQKLVQFKEPLVNVSFVSDLVSLERNVAEADRIFTKFVRKLTSKADVEDAVRNNLLPKEALNKIDKGQAVNLYQKRMPTDQELIDFADQPINVFSEKLGAMVRSGLKGTRKEGFIKRAAIGLVFDAVMEVRQMEDVVEGIGIDTSLDMDIEQFSAQINREVDTKFSRSFADELKTFKSALEKFGVDEVLTSKGRLSKKYKYLNVRPQITKFFADLADDRPQQFEFFKHEFDPKGFARMQAKLPKGATKGHVYEALMQELTYQTFAKELGDNARVYSKDEIVKNWPEVFEKEINKNDIPDIMVWDGTKNGVLLTIETKVGPARAGSYAWNDIAFNKVDANGAWIKEWPMAKLLSDEQLKQLSSPLVDPLQKLTTTLGIKNAQDIVSLASHASVGRNGRAENKNLKFSVRSSIPVDAKFLRDYYNSGKVKLIATNAIQIQGVGIFHLGNDVNNLQELGINQLEGTFGLTIRIMPRSVKQNYTTTGYRYGLRAEIQLRKSKITSKATVDLGRASDAKAIASQVVKNVNTKEKVKDNAFKQSRTINSKTESRGMSTFDFDETLIIEGKNFITATKGDEIVKISSGDWPLVGQRFAEQGYEFDFSDFVNVRGGVDGPLLQKMKNQIKKYGPDNVYVLTARPAESATAIHEWLKSKDINIPLDNITGLGNSTGEAKALWMLDKFAEGYNDMYFVDDALPNVKAVQEVLDQLDVKGKSVRAKVKFSRTMSQEFNKIIEQNKGIDAAETFSKARAERRGKNIGKYEFFISPGADDFTGLLMRLTGKGKKGEQQKEFLHKALVDPYNRAYREMNEMQYNMINDYSNLIKQNPEIKKVLKKDFEGTDFTTEQAIRIYLWRENGIDIPGLSDTEADNIVSKIKADSDLLFFAKSLGSISKQEAGYTKPGSSWVVGNIKSDMKDALDQSRDIFLEEWQQNADEIFSSENLNKLEAAYGPQYVSAMKDILYRMKTGRNRPEGKNAMVNKWLNWINGSVGAIMFINMRSAVLQTLSTVNYLNFENNNIFKAAAAFANQPQFWEDFVFLFNSPTLKVRRSGIQQDLNASELADLVKEGGVKAVIGKLLQLGFTPTQMADSFAISLGGASYYRNQIKFYTKQGLSRPKAETKAFEDFVKVTEETQQSSRPDRISQQQASVLGRLILAFQNTPMQYNRIIKKAGSDLINNRGDWRANVSRIIYYGTAQSLIFSAMQNALFALAFDDEEDEEVLDRKIERISNGMISTILRGSGIKGAVLDTIVKTVKRYAKEQGKDWNKDYAGVLVEALNVSPPIGSKARKIYSAMKTYDWNEEAIGEMPLYDSRNPLWLAVGSVIEGATNAPTERTVKLINNARTMLDQDVATWQRVAVGLGWSRWDVNLGKEQVVEEAKEKGREKVKQVKKAEKQAKQDQLEKKFEADQRKEVKKGKRKITCSAATTSGKRCTNKPVKGGKCTIHEKVEMKSSSAKETQCRRIKSDGKRCKVKTRSKSGFCYYHD